jgi:hypothetical protein
MNITFKRIILSFRKGWRRSLLFIYNRKKREGESRKKKRKKEITTSKEKFNSIKSEVYVIN